MKTKKWLDQVAYKSTMELGGEVNEVYNSKFDDSYITFVGLEKNMKFLADREITEELTHGVGFSPKDKKWYGWSHRAIYGFKIGSTCKKGNCHYVPSKFTELQNDCHCRNKDGECTANCYVELREATTPDKIDGELEVIPGSETAPVKCTPENCVFTLGKGEWTAKTMEDAKQMAIDFNSGVS